MNKSLSLGLLVLVGALGCGQGDESSNPTETEAPAADVTTDEVVVTEQGIQYAPSCITRTVSYNAPQVKVVLKNYCQRFMAVKVVIDNGNDSACMGLWPNETRTFTSYGWYDYTITC